MFSKKPAERSPAGGPRPVASNAGTFSVIGRGSVSPSLTNIGGTSSAGASFVCSTSRRIAAVVRSRRGRMSG